MANKPINALPALDELQSDDLLAVWDSSLNTAVKMSGQQMVARLTEIADGHGGISGIAKTGTAGLNDTYTITYADGTTSTFIVSNGAKGDTGDQTFVWIAYSAVSPTSDADVSVIPAPWMGIYVGLESMQSNLHYTDYTWYEIKGPKGDGVSYTAQTGTAGLTKTYTMYTADGTPVGSFSVTDGEGAVSTVCGIAPDGDGDVSTVVGSVSDLGLTVGSATISDAYTALLDKQVLICPATDFAVGELPLFGGNRQTDGTIEIVKGGTDGWIEFHGRQSSVGDFRMFFTSSDVPSGTWNALPPLKSVTYTAWETVGTIRTDSSSLLVYLPASSLAYGTYSANAIAWTVMLTGTQSGVLTSELTPTSIERASPDMICIQYSRPSTISQPMYGLAAARGNLTITAQ